MIQALQKFIKNTFDIREGEGLRACLMQLNLFLVISTLLIVKPAVSGLFLSKIGVQALPFAFVLVSVFAAVITLAYARFLGKIPLNRILLGTIGISVGLFILFGFLLKFNIVEGWVLYAFYIWVAIFGVLTASQFWILANVVFNVREAKRLFGFIGSGAIGGGIFGGYLTSILAERIGSENLLFVAAALLVLCIPITVTIWKTVLSTQTKFQRRKKISKSEKPWQLILKSRHLTFLAGIIGVSVIVAKLVDYQFSAIASATISDPDELTAFFGFWFSNFNVISLLVQLLLTRYLVGTLGVGTSLFFLPAGILLGAILLFFFPELWVAIFIKMSDGSLKQSINKAAIELLALPIPLEIKKQTKTFIDVFVDSVATGIGGIILIFLVKGLDLSTKSISLMITALIILWIYFVFRVREAYLNAFKLKISPVLDSGPNKKPVPNYKSILSGWKKVLESGSEKQMLYVLQKIREQPDERFFESIHNLLNHPSKYIRTEALVNLYYFKNKAVIKDVMPLCYDSSQSVKIAAFEYLLGHKPNEIAKVLDIYLKDPNHKVHQAALISLAKESKINPALKNRFNLVERIKNQYRQLEQLEDNQSKISFKIGLLKAIGYAQIPELFPMIESFLKDENPEVKTQAIVSAGNTLHPHFIPLIVPFLGDPPFKEKALFALTSYGREILKVLQTYINKEEISLEVKRSIPLVMRAFGTQESANLLFELLKFPDSGVRLSALRSLNYLKVNYPHLNYYKRIIGQYILEEAKLYQEILTVLYVQIQLPEKEPGTETVFIARKNLITLLEKRLDRNLERIFRLLGLRYHPEDIINIFESIQSKQVDLRINAIEYLDNLLEPGLKKILIPLVETAMMDNLSEEAILQLRLKIPGELEGYQMLLNSYDVKIVLAVLYLIEQLQDKRFIPLLEKISKTENQKIRRSALTVLKALKKTADGSR